MTWPDTADMCNVLLFRRWASNNLGVLGCCQSVGGTFSCNWRRVNLLTFSANTTLLAIGTLGDVQIWNIHSHALISTIARRSLPYRTQFAPDDSQLASLASHYTSFKTKHLELWEIETGDCLASVQLNSTDFDNVAFGADGNSVVLDSKNTQTRERWSISPRTRHLSTDNNHNDDHSPLLMTFVPVHDTQQPASPDVPSQQVYYKSIDEWILDNQGRRLCWLLPDRVVIGCENARVMILDISDVRC